MIESSALGVDCAVVQLDDPAHEREPEPESAVTAVGCRLRLHEKVENGWQHVGRDTHTIVVDG